jgi:hypothetical protein
LLAPRPTPKLEDHPLSAVRDCLFNVSAATLHIWRILHLKLLGIQMHKFHNFRVTIDASVIRAMISRTRKIGFRYEKQPDRAESWLVGKRVRNG